MKTVEVTTELIKEVHSQVSTDLKQRIEKELPDLFNKLEFNRWLKDDYFPNWLGFYDGKGKFYGLDLNGKWIEIETKNTPNTDGRNRYATEEEVKTALVNEAVKRGFELGKKVKWNFYGSEGYKCSNITKDYFEYFVNKNKLELGCGIIFDNGKWATLITEPTERELLGDKIKDLEKNLEEVKSLYDKL